MVGWLKSRAAHLRPLISFAETGILPGIRPTRPGISGDRMLTDAAARAARPKKCPYRLTDGGGLHLFVTPAGG